MTLDRLRLGDCYLTVEFPDGPKWVEAEHESLEELGRVRFQRMARVVPVPIDGWEFAQIVTGEWFAYSTWRETRDEE
jgi:hypothetical protein